MIHWPPTDGRWALRCRRLRLLRPDGRVALERWGLELRALGGIFVHRIDAPDPGPDLHDHPWWFASLVIRGGYSEERAPIRLATQWNQLAEKHEVGRKWRGPRGVIRERRRWSLRSIRLDECHRIVLVQRPTWTLVVHGPHRRQWGFYTPRCWVADEAYLHTVRGKDRGLIDALNAAIDALSHVGDDLSK